jgi:predicted transcriptional regulator
MPCHLPLPYPDELLYSVIARYLIHIGAKSAKCAAGNLFGRTTKAQVDIPGSIESVSSRTWPIWGMSGEEILNRLTLFPYYVRYMPQNRVAHYLKMLLSDNSQGIHARLGVNGSRVKARRFLRFCRVCRETDQKRYGETYWHRSHQLVGVLVCPEHGEPLIATKAPMRPRRYFDYADATLSTGDTVIADKRVLDENIIIKALKIAKRCQEMLLGPIELWPAENISQGYRRAVIERGFTEGPAAVSQNKVENAFVSFYGKTLLSMLGCEVREGTGNSWINTIFQKHRSLFHPVEHALVQIFIESVPVSQPSNPLGFGPWKCPNPYAEHEEKFPITKAKFPARRKEHFIASLTCSCGFKFTCSRTSDDDPHLPIVKKHLQFGPAWVAEAKRLREAGLSTYSIGIKMGIAYSTVRHLLNNKSNGRAPSTNQIKQWREKWMKLLDSVPNQSRSIAREKCWKLYNRLRLHDRKWLFAKPGNKTRKPHPEGQVNWARRDAQWSRRLRDAASKIAKEVPLERVTRNAMVTQAGICSSIFAYINRLPACRLALSECSESLKNFRQRAQCSVETSGPTLCHYRHHREEICHSPGSGICDK